MKTGDIGIGIRAAEVTVTVLPGLVAMLRIALDFGIELQDRVGY
jgi:hypothetical protein